jgi:hypothetical protein
VPREAKLVAFLLVLVVIFLGARAVGSAVGPLTTGRSPVTYTGTTGTGGGMNMNMNGPAASPSPASSSQLSSQSPGRHR